MQLLGPTGNTLLNTTSSSNAEFRFETSVLTTGNYFLRVFDRSQGLPSENYQVHLRRLAADSTVLTGITSTANRGTPKHSGIASANVGQVITLVGNGLRMSDRVVFNKGQFYNGDFAESVVTPLSVSADGTSLTVRVPPAGREDSLVKTGSVQLASDPVGLYLQVVPTLDRIEVFKQSDASNRSVQLYGSGFDYPSSWQVGGTTFTTDYDDRNNLAGLPFGPITMTTTGGTSEVLAGQDLVTIASVATTGAPLNPLLPSANPGQSITINGSRLAVSSTGSSYASSLLIFKTIDAAGVRGERAVQPTSASADGTSMTVVVPNNAITGPVGIMGDPQGTSLLLQIVPVVTSIVPSSTSVRVNGRGLIEGGTLYRFGDLEVLDGSVSNAGVNVDTNNNDRAIVSATIGSSGTLTVTTAGGTSAPLSYGAMVAARTASSSAIRSATSNLTPKLLRAFATEVVAALDSILPGSIVPIQTPTLMWEIRDLPGDYLGFASGNTIYLDYNAAGWGWFVDLTPKDDSEFHRSGNQGEQDRMDLLSVVMHELGHFAGHDHSDDSVMSPELEAGKRNLFSDDDYESLTDHFFRLASLDPSMIASNFIPNLFRKVS
jgi:hypothetical protein